MQRSGAIASRVAFVRLNVNGRPAGVFVNTEQVDKTFLADLPRLYNGQLLPARDIEERGFKIIV